jgi:histone-lysine N-methyltransferase SUV39H
MPNYDSDDIDQLQSDAEGNERWRASEPPPDPWGDVDGADEEGNWRFQIIGEEVDHEGNIKYVSLYTQIYHTNCIADTRYLLKASTHDSLIHVHIQVRWDDWHRSDGTKTTWEGPENTGINSAQWTREQRKRRRSLAAETLSIEVPSTTDIHNDATYLRSQAYEEKLLRVEKEPQPNLVVEMGRLLAEHQAHIHPPGMGMGQGASTSDSPLRSSQRTSARQHTLNSIASSSTPGARGSSKGSVQFTTTKPSLTTASSSKSHTTQAKSSATSDPSYASASANSRPGLSSVVASSASHKSAQPSGTVNPLTLKPHPSSSVTPADKGKRRMLDSDSNALPTLKDLTSMPRKRVKQTTSSSGQSNAPEALQQSSSSTLSGRTASASSTPMAKAKTMPSTTPVRQTTPAKETPEAQRKKLGDAWTKVARERGGARISFFNDVDDEAIPLISDSFRYLECSYLL